MIPAWADSVLMYWGSSVAYENSGLEDDLIAELQAWDTSYCDGCGDGERWRWRTLQATHQSVGMRLAQRVADSLGRPFAVEFDERIVESHRQAATPAAASAFGAHAEKRAAMLDKLAGQMAGGGSNDKLAVTPDPCPDRTAGQWLREGRARTTRRVRVRLRRDYSVGFPVEVVVDGEADSSMRTCWESAIRCSGTSRDSRNGGSNTPTTRLPPPMIQDGLNGVTAEPSS